MVNDFFVRELPNGMTLLGQRMDSVKSAALTFLVPAGASHDPEQAAGCASVLCEWCFRGAGARDTHQFNDALDALGCQRSESVQSEHLQFAAAQLGTNTGAVLDLYADVLLRPALPEEAFEPSRALVAQDLAGLEDEPAHKANVLLREKFYPHPMGRCVCGSQASLAALTAPAVRQFWRECFVPEGTILAVAGSFDWRAFSDQARRAFGDWPRRAAPAVPLRQAAGGVTHVPKESAQTHLALAHRSVPFRDRRYYPARMAEMVLSGGMGSRLFTEVREKRGLVYAVAASYHSLKDHAGMFTYAGTTPQRAQETLEVVVGELRRLAKGILPAEMARARTQLKTAIVMQGESTTARSNALAGDWYHLRRLRDLPEIALAIDAVTVDEVLDYLQTCPAMDFTVLVLGPEAPDTTGIMER